jgi:acyl-CoA synthetase (NDP forming)
MPKAAVDQMRTFIPVAGSSVNNPIDAMPDAEHMDEMLRIVATAEGIDIVMMSPMSGRPATGAQTAQQMRAAMSPQSADQPISEEASKAMVDAAKQSASHMRRMQDETGALFVGIQRGGRMARMMGMGSEAFSQAAYEQGIAAFPSVTRAARTLSQVLKWRAYREGLPDIL